MAYVKYFQINNTNDKNNISLRNVIFSVLISYLIFIIFVSVISLLSVYGNLETMYADRFTKIFYYITVIICGFMSSYKKRRNGWFNGTVSSFSYWVCMLLTAFTVGAPGFNVQMFVNLFFTVISGIIGGILGVNTQKKKKR